MEEPPPHLDYPGFHRWPDPITPALGVLRVLGWIVVAWAVTAGLGFILVYLMGGR
jgi:hypothetical protein